MKYPIADIGSRQNVATYFPPGGIGAEFGVDAGDNAADLIRYANADQIYLVDFWSVNGNRPGYEDWKRKKGAVLIRFADQIAAGKVTVVDSPFEEFLAGIPDGYLDWAYLDGWHRYHNVTKDCADILPKIKRGGIFAGHDFKVEPADWGTGCPRAVLEMVQNGVGPLLGLSNEENPDWIIRKGGYSL